MGKTGGGGSWKAVFATGAALVAIAVALVNLIGATAGLTITQAQVSGIPVEVFAPPARGRAPAVVIAHGFAGSRQLMHPFATSLASNGYVAVTFDLPGHGRNATPLPGGLADHEARTRALVDSLASVAGYARGLAAADGRVAVLGHSMASEVVVRHARAHPDTAATVAVSLYSHDVTATSPRNLLVIDGALEPDMLTNEGLRVVAMANGGTARDGITYGSFEEGTARRLVLAEGVEHIGVLYSRQALTEARDWLDHAFGLRGAGYIDARGPWLGLLYLGLIALAWNGAKLLPRLAAEPLGASLRWDAFLPVAIAPAVLTPLLLAPVPHGGLPILLGDYLAMHFGLYGALTMAGLWWAKRRSQGDVPKAGRTDRGKLALAMLVAASFLCATFGFATDRFASSFALTGIRPWLLLALLAGTLPYFLADEWLVRGSGAPRAAVVITRLAFLLSLAIAIALDLRGLFFLVIIVPAILVFFVVFGLLAGAAYRRTNHPLVGGAANAVLFAWAIAASFPVVR